MPATLKQLMRHSSIDTTMKYYVDLDAEDVASDLWATWGNTSGNNGPKAAKEQEEAQEGDSRKSLFSRS